MSVTYRMKGDAVVIEDKWGTIPAALDLESAKAAVEHIKAHRDRYKTKEAYQRHLSKYEGALAFLEAELARKGRGA